MCKCLGFNLLKLTLDVHRSALPLSALHTVQLLSPVYIVDVHVIELLKLGQPGVQFCIR